MTLPIIEEPLYGRIQFETTSTSGAFSWVDQTQYLTSTSYTEGRSQIMVGDVGPEVGTLTASFKNMATVPASGDYVRIRRYGTTEYAFTGYVQDVSQRIVFDRSVSLTTPLTITTIVCLDWVGLLTQFPINGIDGRNAAGTFLSGAHTIADRARSLNYEYDTTGATELIEITTVSALQNLAVTDFQGTIADHLDLACRSIDAYWWGNHIIPTNATTGRDKMVSYRGWSSNSSSGKTFTDVAGSAGQLHYTEIDFTSSSANVSNVINLTNRARIRPPEAYFTRLGGSNEQAVIPINNNRSVIGIVNEEVWTSKDATSVTNYGARVADLETNVDTPVFVIPTSIELGNLIANPSLDYDDSGFSSTGSSATVRTRRRGPGASQVPYIGDWALRSRVTVAGAQVTASYSGGESDGIPVAAGQYFYFKASAARDTTSRTDVTATAKIEWFDETETFISRSTGTTVPLTTAGTWYQPFVLGLAPAGAVRATVNISFNRSGGGNHSVGDQLWTDALFMTRCNSTGGGLTGVYYFDGDTVNTSAVMYAWIGDVGNSQTVVLENYVDDLGTTLTSRFSTTSMRATRIRWNAQEDLTAVSSLSVGKTISLTYKGTTATYRIIGLQADITQERYMVDYYLWKV